MIINHEEVLSGIESQKQINLNAKGVKTVLKQVAVVFDNLYKNAMESNKADSVVAAERKINEIVLKSFNQEGVLFDPAILGFEGINKDTVLYSFSSKEEVVGEYVVDVLNVSFKQDTGKSECKVAIPLYFITDSEQNHSLLPMYYDGELVYSSVESMKIF